MKIRQLTVACGPGLVAMPGEVRDVTEKEAADAIAGGFAEAVAASPSVKLVEAAHEQRKADLALTEKDGRL